MCSDLWSRLGQRIIDVKVTDRHHLRPEAIHRPGQADPQTVTWPAPPPEPGRCSPGSVRHGPPHGVTAAGHEAASQAVARVLSMIVGSGMARLIAETAAYRLSGPRLQNTDGDPMVLVKATPDGR